MFTKRKIRRLAEKELAGYDNPQKREQLIMENYPVFPKKISFAKRYKQGFIGAFAAVLICVVAVGAMFGAGIFGLINDEDNLFLGGNMQEKEAEIDEIMSAFCGITINKEIDYYGICKTGYSDSKYVFYYSLEYLDVIESGDGTKEERMQILFHNRKSSRNYSDSDRLTAIVGGQTVYYYEEIEKNGDIDIIKTEGVIMLNKKFITLKYSMIRCSETTPSGFLQLCNRILI